METITAPKDGHGDLLFNYYVSAKAPYDRCKMIARIKLHPGDSIGRHDHSEDAELYYIISGNIDVEDNGVWQTLSEGDLIYTSDGEFHQAKNNSNKEATMLAVIIK